MTAIVDFRTTYPVGRPPEDWVCVAPQGPGYERTQTWVKISKIKPKEDVDENVRNSPTYQALLGRWSIIGPKYEAWKDSSEIPEDGMALSAWSGVTKEIAEVLRRQGIKTVEAVAGMSVEAAAKLPMPNARKLPVMAQEYLKGRDAVAAQNEVESLKEQIAAMREMLEAQQGEKRGPGRPRKEAVDA